VRLVASACLVVLAAAAAILGYGYRFGATHGSLSVSVLDVSDRGRPRNVPSVRVSFLDAAGQTLAEAQAAPPAGTIYLMSPARYACHDVEERAAFSDAARRGWDECFERQSRWLPTWVRSVRAVDLQSGACAIAGVPATISERADTWWLWWVPLPHIGGKPYTSFSLTIQVDWRTRCGGPGGAFTRPYSL
jgi:hypothetical protein